jgi:hypothetical protein
MNLSEEELQNSMEAGKSPDATNADEKAYRLLFDSLSKQPELGLSAAFPDRVIQKVMAHNQKKESSRDIWWLGVGIFFMLIGLVVAIAFVGARFDLGFLKAMADYKGLVAAGAILITVFNLLDKKIVRSRMEI